MNERLKTRLHGPAIYNPDLLSRDELIRGFVARQDLLRALVEGLRQSLTHKTVQHHLLLGQRGMGKTTLLHRLRYAVEDDEMLCGVWLPLVFPEEQYEIAHLSDFYFNCVDALSDALENRGHAAEAQRLDAALTAIPNKPEPLRAEQALTLLTETAKRFGFRLLLLLDNIDLLLRRLADEDWKLRELLSSEDWLCVIGTSAVALETTFDYNRAFYDFFQVHALESLSEAECREVLLALSKLYNTPHVSEWVNKEPARLKTLRVLTGGNPRTVALLHTVTASSSGGDIRSDLERLLDQVTALYKHRFEALSDQAQRVVHALALYWQPASAADIAELTRLDVNTVSSQLNRLVTDGVVEKVPFYPETKTGFQIAERFFNIWYLMRQSRRVRHRLMWLVEFLKMFYEHEELGTHARGVLGGEPGISGSGRSLYFVESAFAYADAVDDGILREALQCAGVHTLIKESELREKLGVFLDLEGEDASLRPMVDRHQAAREIRERVLSVKHDFEGWDAEEFADLLGGMLRSREMKLKISHAVKGLTPEKFKNFCRVAHEEIRKLESKYGPSAVQALRRALQEGFVEGLEDCGALEAAALAMNAPILETLALILRFFRGESIEAERLGRLLPDSEMPWGWLAYGVLLLKEGRQERAEAALLKSISLGDELGVASHLLGLHLSTNPDRLDEAEQHLRVATTAARGKEVPEFTEDRLRFLAYFLVSKRNHFDEAADAYRQVIELNQSNAEDWAGLALSLFVLSEQRAEPVPEEAESAIREAMRLDPANMKTVLPAAAILLARNAWPEAAELARRFIGESSHEQQIEVWDAVVAFFQIAVLKGKTPEAGALLDESELGERWLPLREALRIIAADNPQLLRKLAPEIREPTQILIERLSASLQQAPKTPAPAKKRAPTRKKKA